MDGIKLYSFHIHEVLSIPTIAMNWQYLKWAPQKLLTHFLSHGIIWEMFGPNFMHEFQWITNFRKVIFMFHLMLVFNLHLRHNKKSKRHQHLPTFSNQIMFPTHLMFTSVSINFNNSSSLHLPTHIRASFYLYLPSDNNQRTRLMLISSISFLSVLYVLFMNDEGEI